jgi:hypothetical protein
MPAELMEAGASRPLMRMVAHGIGIGAHGELEDADSRKSVLIRRAKRLSQQIASVSEDGSTVTMLKQRSHQSHSTASTNTISNEDSLSSVKAVKAKQHQRRHSSSLLLAPSLAKPSSNRTVSSQLEVHSGQPTLQIAQIAATAPATSAITNPSQISVPMVLNPGNAAATTVGNPVQQSLVLPISVATVLILLALAAFFLWERLRSTRPQRQSNAKFATTRSRSRRSLEKHNIATARAGEWLRARLQAAMEGEQIQDSISLQRACSKAGIDLIAVDASDYKTLEQEINENKSEVLWVNDPKTGAIQLVRFVRLIRIRIFVTSPLNASSWELYEVSRLMMKQKDEAGENQRPAPEMIGKPLTRKVCLDEGNLFEATQTAIKEQLSLSFEDQEASFSRLDVEDAGPEGYVSYVETGESKYYAGLPTWYLINELHYSIDYKQLDIQVAKRLGLPDIASFQTTERHSIEEIIYCWEWFYDGAKPRKT